MPAIFAEVRRGAALYLPGSSGNYVSCPDSAALSIVGDVEMVARVAATDWTPAAEQCFVGKYTTSGDQRSYAFGLFTDGTLTCRFSSDGLTPSWGTVTSITAAGLTDLTAYWLKCTIDVNNGASGSTVRFYKADDEADEPTVWTQVGSDRVVATGGISIADTTAVLEVGSIAVGTTQLFGGKVHRAIVRSGIGGTKVADYRADVPSLRFRDVHDNLWTVNGSANAFALASPS
jgi:hypothetical protein